MRQHSQDVHRTPLAFTTAAEWLQPRWYALFVRSHQEHNVCRHLAAREIEHFLPTYISIRQWRDRKVKLSTPLFPGYIFVRMPRASCHQALLVPRVVDFVGRKDSPSVISETEIEWIRCGIVHGNAQPFSCMASAIGDAVVITGGPMAGLEGVFLRNGNGTRVVVTVNSISRSFLIEVESSFISPGQSYRARQNAA